MKGIAFLLLMTYNIYACASPKLISNNSILETNTLLNLCIYQSILTNDSSFALNRSYEKRGVAALGITEFVDEVVVE